MVALSGYFSDSHCCRLVVPHHPFLSFSSFSKRLTTSAQCSQSGISWMPWQRFRSDAGTQNQNHDQQVRKRLFGPTLFVISQAIQHWFRNWREHK